MNQNTNIDFRRMLEKDLANCQTNNYLSVSKDAILGNYLKLKNTNTTVKFGVVLKANAYGLGFVEYIAALLHKSGGCEHFFVGNLEEALKIRSNIRREAAKIYLLYNYFDTDLAEKCIENSIIPIINSVLQIESWINYSININTKITVVVKIDAGFNRMGLRLGDMDDNLSNRIKSYLDVDHVSMHLACGGSENPKNTTQLMEFSNVVNEYFRGYNTSVFASNFLTSNINFRDTSIVRVGGGIYGLYKKTINDELGLEFPIKVRARVLNIFNIAPGESVGYGASFEAKTHMKLATVAVGYSDGLPHNAGNGAYSFKVNGKLATTVGVISMNLTVINVTMFNSEDISEGDYVSVVDDYEDIYKMKSILGTSTLLDVFCSMNRMNNKFIV